MSGVWAVVPAKDLAQAKRRLSELLSLKERQALAAAMLEDVLVALAAVRGLSGRVVMTRDPALAALAQAWGAQVIADLRHVGPSEAVALAVQKLAEAKGLLAIPADVPQITPGEVDEILAAMHPAPSIALVPALADMGTNALALSPPDLITPCYGTRSFFAHQEAALARGIAPRVLRLPGIGLDIDRPEDLHMFLSSPSATRSYCYLTESGIATRLEAGIRRQQMPQ
jgi:2-phospho-L-lactate guanylyltransferase